LICFCKGRALVSSHLLSRDGLGHTSHKITDHIAWGFKRRAAIAKLCIAYLLSSAGVEASRVGNFGLDLAQGMMVSG
jgi:hypothetical protein